MKAVITVFLSASASSSSCASARSPSVWNVSATRSVSGGPASTKCARAGPTGCEVGGEPVELFEPVGRVVDWAGRVVRVVASPLSEHATAMRLVAAATRKVRRSMLASPGAGSVVDLLREVVRVANLADEL